MCLKTTDFELLAKILLLQIYKENTMYLAVLLGKEYKVKNLQVLCML